MESCRFDMKFGYSRAESPCLGYTERAIPTKDKPGGCHNDNCPKWAVYVKSKTEDADRVKSAKQAMREADGVIIAAVERGKK